MNDNEPAEEHGELPRVNGALRAGDLGGALLALPVQTVGIGEEWEQGPLQEVIASVPRLATAAGARDWDVAPTCEYSEDRKAYLIFAAWRGSDTFHDVTICRVGEAAWAWRHRWDWK